MFGCFRCEACAALRCYARACWNDGLHSMKAQSWEWIFPFVDYNQELRQDEATWS